MSQRRKHPLGLTDSGDTTEVTFVPRRASLFSAQADISALRLLSQKLQKLRITP